MAKDRVKGVKVMTPNFKANWCNLFTPVPQMDASKPPVYKITMLFEKGQDLSGLKKAAKDAIIEKWGKDKTKWPKGMYVPFKDQGTALRKRDDESEYLPDGYTPGAIYLDAKTQSKPGVVDQNVDDIIDESEIYSGMIARATVVFKSYDFLGKQGITVYLQHVQKVADGKPMGGKVTAEMDFTPIGNSGDDADTFASASDESDEASLGL